MYNMFDYVSENSQIIVQMKVFILFFITFGHGLRVFRWKTKHGSSLIKKFFDKSLKIIVIYA